MVDTAIDAPAIRRQLRELVAEEGHISGDPAAVAKVRGVLREIGWLQACEIHDRNGQRHDLIEALLYPNVLGSPPRAYQGDKPFALIRKYQELSELVDLDTNWKLKVDMSGTKRSRTLLFVEGVGMLTLQQPDGARAVVSCEGLKEEGLAVL
jgi:hypothetical protein